MVIAADTLERLIRDAIAQKRVLKWGYVRQFGGLYPSECDSVASHSHAVAVLANIFALELSASIKSATEGYELAIEDVALMAAFHDFGECRSGDTGAASHSVSGTCNLHPLEREGLDACVDGLSCKERVLALWDSYRSGTTPEAMVVRTADLLEGVEKAMHASRGTLEIVTQIRRIVAENVDMFYSRFGENEVGKTSEILFKEILLPGLKRLELAYNIGLNLRE